MQTSFLRKTLIADEQNSAIHIPVEWYGAEIEVIAFPVEMQKQNFNDVQDDKINALNSLLNFANDNKIIEKDFYFDRESCYDR